MEEVFSGWPTFNQDISNWDTSKVESMYGMFKSSKYVGNKYAGPTSFNQDISNWDVSNVKNMSEMFLGATSFNQDISNWDVSNVENMAHMFSGATSFNQPIGNWNVSNVKNMSHMFSDISSIGILAFVGTLEYTRAGSTSFNQDISNWDVSNVNDITSMFSGATSFNQDISSWNLSKVISFSSMFSGAISFNQDISNWNVSNVVNMYHMFSGATSFNQKLESWDISKVTTTTNMFSGATSFNQPIGNWDMSNVLNMNYMFSGATSFNQDISNWDVGSLSETVGVFYGATSFNSPIGKWNVKSVTNMEDMFREASAFNQDISNWDVSNVTQMKGMFQDATSFNQDITNWKLNEKLPKSRTMFKDAKAFNIKEFSPFLNIKAKKREVDTSTANLSSEDKKIVSKIKKLLVTRDYDKIDLGLELLISLNNIELFETLLHDCKMEDIDLSSPKLKRNKFFTGSGPAQPYLDYVLIHIIANTPQEAKIDKSILLKNITSLDVGRGNSTLVLKPDDCYGGISRLLPLSKFTSLKSLSIDLELFKIKNSKIDLDNEDVVDIEDMFPSSLIDLKLINAKGSLKFFKNFINLKTLDISTDSYCQIIDYDSFKYLENLLNLSLSFSKSDNLKNCDFLSHCKKLKTLNFRYSVDAYSSSNDDLELENIDFLSKLNDLEDLRINSLYEFMNTENLTFSKNLKKLSLSVSGENNLTFLLKCNQIKELELRMDGDYKNELKVLEKCENLESLIISNFDNLHLYGKIKEVDGFNGEGLNNLKTLSYGSFNISGCEDGKLMTELNKSSNSSSINIETRVNVDDVILVRDIIHYKGYPFNGTVYLESKIDGEQTYLIHEFSVLNGIKDGIYREFYFQSNKIKLELKFKNDEIEEIIGFYNNEGINLIKGQNCIINSNLFEKNGLLLKDGKAFTGLCFLEMNINKKDRWSYSSTKPFFDMSLFETIYSSETKYNFNSPLKDRSLNRMHFNREMNKVSIILNVENGIISRNLLLANKHKFKKVSIANDFIYGFDLNDSSLIKEKKTIFVEEGLRNYNNIFQSNYNELPEDQFYRYYVYSDKVCDIPVDIEGDENKVNKTKSFYSVISDEEEIKGHWNYIAKRESKPKLTADVKKSFAEIKKLLNSRDFDKIEQAVEKLVLLNNNELFETLLEKCEFHSSSGNRKLITNDFFNGSGPAQPFLNYAFFLVIANTPENAGIHHSLLRKNMSSLDLKDFLSKENVPDRFIPIGNFSQITNLKLDLEIFLTNKGYFSEVNTKVNRGNWFENNNITNLKVNNATGSLKWFKNFSDLKFLEFEFGYYKSEMDLESFEFLENLEELDLSKINYGDNQKIKNLDFIRKSKKIRKLSLNIYDSYGDSDNLENLDFLEDLINLEELSISGLSGNINLDGLLFCRKLHTLSISANTYANDKSNNFSFQLLKNCNSLEELSISGLDGKCNIYGKILDIDGLKDLKKLKFISLDEVDISSDGEVFINK